VLVGKTFYTFTHGLSIYFRDGIDFVNQGVQFLVAELLNKLNSMGVQKIEHLELSEFMDDRRDKDE